jgi:hypothetical protein
MRELLWATGTYLLVLVAIVILAALLSRWGGFRAVVALGAAATIGLAVFLLIR